ncbi:MAG: ABC transporter substrate-binding protein [Thermodesulfobacteriota bacterium]
MFAQQKDGVRKWLVVTLAILFMTGLSSLDAFAAEKISEMKVGVILPLSGPPAAMGIGGKQALETYFDHINARGGIKSLGGAKLKMILSDSTAKPDVGVTEAERLIVKDKIHVLIGCYQSGVTLPVSKVAQKYQLPMISFAGNSDKILQQGNDWIIRTGPWESGIAYARYVALETMNKQKKLNLKKVAVVYIDDEWGQSGERSVKALAPEFGCTIVASEPHPANISDFTSIVINLKKAAPDAIMLNTYAPQTLLFLKTKYELDLGGGVICVSGIQDPGFLPSAGKTAWHLFLVYVGGANILENKSAKVKELAAEYEKKYKESVFGEGASFGYQCGQALVVALEKAGTVEHNALMKALSTLKIPYSDLMTPYEIEISSDFLGMKGQNKKCIIPVAQVDEKLNIHFVSPPEKGYTAVWPVLKASEWK